VKADRQVGFTFGYEMPAVVGVFGLTQWVFPNGGQVDGWIVPGFTYWWDWKGVGDAFFTDSVTDPHEETAFGTAPLSIFMKGGYSTAAWNQADDQSMILVQATTTSGGALRIPIAPGGSIFFAAAVANVVFPVQIYGWEFSSENLQQRTMRT